MTWRQKARRLKSEIRALYLAYKDPRVPLHAKLIVALVVGYALSPIDLIPDFIPVLGYLDDVILLPLGIAFSIKLIPNDVLAEACERARALEDKPVNKAGAVAVVLIWLLLAAAAIALILQIT